MRKIFTIGISLLSFHCAMAQNVGIGTTTPAMPLHVRTATDTALLMVENTATLTTGSNTGIYLKNGNYFTGALKATGTGTALSRVGLFSYAAQNQNNLREYLSVTDNGYVGVGTIDPKMLFHVRSTTDTAVAVFENGNTMATGTNVGLYFKNGTNYTGALKTTATGPNTSRIGLYSYAGSGPGTLREYLSVLDDGKVGIGTTAPTEQLTVNGIGSFINTSSSQTKAALDVSSSSSSAPAINATGSTYGIQGSSISGVGIIGYSGSFVNPGIPVGVMGQSSNGPGVYGYSSKSNSYAVAGVAPNSDVIGGYFINFNGGKALYTSGSVQISGQGAGAGKVLTSDASGNATWQAPTGGATIAFSAYLTSNTSVAAGASQDIVGYTEQFDDGSAFNAATGEFRAPSAGLYQFTFTPGIGHPLLSSPLRVRIYMLINSSVSGYGNNYVEILPQNTQTNTSSLCFTRLLKLATNDGVKINVVVDGAAAGVNVNIIGGTANPTTIFSGVKLN